jgi:polyphosphate kinase
VPDKEPRYINRELSWLEFNQRVLDEARDPTNPLLERLKFLAITSSNLDEFFMVRVGSLKIVEAQGRTKPDPSGLSPKQQLEAIGRRARQMLEDQYKTFNDDVGPALQEAGIRHLAPDELSERQRDQAEYVFDNEISSVLSPIAVSSADDLPLLPNQTIIVCVRLNAINEEEGPRYALVPFGSALNRFLTLPSEGGYACTLLENVVAMFADRFFPSNVVEECVPFRITRNADVSVQDDLAADLLEEMEDMLAARKQTACVRLEVAVGASEQLLGFLKSSLQVNDQDVFVVPGPLDLAAFFQITDLPGFDELKNENWPPQPSVHVDPTVSMFDVIRDHDVLLCHPYESFEPVVRLVEEAADDPDVLAIKQILYRTSRKSPIVAALRRAAERGKYVTAVVELKARFDEARNIEWAKSMERSGVQVIYGVKRLKTHAKVCIVIRREPHGIQRYVHFGTGNYNEQTARLYSDVSYLTANEDFGADAATFFNSITGYSQPQQYRKIAAAPIGLREEILEMIESETHRRREGQKARIVAKVNSLADPKIIEAFYAASVAGVSIKLNVRGICCLRPGVPGLSENISVTSIVDRFLEHARIFYFYHGGDERVFISSADWMPRNLDRRVELLVPIEDTACRQQLISILDTYFRDNTRARRILPDGKFELTRPGGKPALRSQEELYRMACQAVKAAQQTQQTVFEPHKAPEARVP